MVEKPDIADLVKNADLDKKKVAPLATKAELKAEQDKIVKLQVFDWNWFWGKSHFEDDGTQNYLVFHQCTDIFKKLLILVILHWGNLKYFLIKLLNLLLHLIIVLLRLYW